MEYGFREIEKKWQEYWIHNERIRRYSIIQISSKCYVLDMFPYPSGAGLHVGHPARVILLPDIYARYKRSKGFNVAASDGV